MSDAERIAALEAKVLELEKALREHWHVPTREVAITKHGVILSTKRRRA